MDVATIAMTVISGLLGGGLIAFVQFLITRKDNKDQRFKDITESIEKLVTKMDELDAKEDRHNAEARRIRILRFADEMLQDHKHSKDSWDQAIVDCEEYEQYCDKHPKFKNGQTEATVKFINEGYQDRLKKHDFL